MTQLSIGHVLTGATLASVGATGLVAGAMGSAALPAAILRIPGGTFAMTVGGVLLGGGLLVLAFSRKKAPEPEPTVLAHVAFASRQHAAPEEPPPQVARPRRASALSQAPPVSQIDLQIREVTKEINKAGVMLATGKLSRDGYVQYVDDLKRQRSELEAAKMDVEMQRRP